MAGVGLLLILVIAQIVLSFAGARRLGDRGIGPALVPVLVVPAAVLLLAIGLSLEAGGFSEGFARATPILAAALLALLVIGSITVVVAIRRRK